MPPVKLALILDNTVVDILHTDDRLAAIFTSKPEIIDVTGPGGQPSVLLNATYDPLTGTFTNPPTP